MNLTTETQLLKLKSIFNQISDASYSFSRLNKQYPIDSLDEETAKKVISAYVQFLENVRDAIKNYEKSAGMD